METEMKEKIDVRKEVGEKGWLVDGKEGKGSKGKINERNNGQDEKT